MFKTITIKKAVYDELIKVKQPDESFSELLDRLVQSKDKGDVLLSLRGSINFTDKEAMLRESQERRWERRI
jgi:predicted CopG family antitoxin